MNNEKLYTAAEVAQMLGRSPITIRGIGNRHNLGIKRGSVRLYTESDIAAIRTIDPKGGRPPKEEPYKQIIVRDEADLIAWDQKQWNSLITDLQQALEKLENRIARQRQELHSARQTVQPQAGETMGDLARRLSEREASQLATYFTERKEIEEKFAERAERDRKAREAYRAKWYKEGN